MGMIGCVVVGVLRCVVVMVVCFFGLDVFFVVYCNSV